MLEIIGIMIHLLLEQELDNNTREDAFKVKQLIQHEVHFKVVWDLFPRQHQLGDRDYTLANLKLYIQPE
jgi:hypothetical protein